MITDPARILKEIQEFYGKLYSFQDAAQATLDENNVNKALFDQLDTPKLAEDEKQFLENPLTKQEIFDVIKSMKHNKSPGLDGLPVEYYIVFWPDICDMLINSFNFSLQNGMMSSSQRNGVITILPQKDKDHQFIKNYRPVTLLTVDYKILAKCLANRLKSCMQPLIHSDQSVFFLTGRNIGVFFFILV